MEPSNTKTYDNGAFLAGCDVIRLAQKVGYPMDGQLHKFIELACQECGWSETEVFQKIFKEKS